MNEHRHSHGHRSARGGLRLAQQAVGTRLAIAALLIVGIWIVVIALVH